MSGLFGSAPKPPPIVMPPPVVTKAPEAPPPAQDTATGAATPDELQALSLTLSKARKQFRTKKNTVSGEEAGILKL